MPESQAQYEILVPPSSQVGTARATAQYLSQQIQGTVHVQPKRTIFNEGVEDVVEPVTVTAVDSPQTDSTIKQAAAYVAEVAARDTVLVSKNGKAGIQVWPIRNTTGAPPSRLRNALPPTPMDSASSP